MVVWVPNFVGRVDLYLLFPWFLMSDHSLLSWQMHKFHIKVLVYVKRTGKFVRSMGIVVNTTE